MSLINYNHDANRHTLEGPEVALPLLLGSQIPQSILDVGCGTGTWLRAAMGLEIKDVQGIDGIEVSDQQFLIPKSLFRKIDLTEEWNLGRQFDLVLCLEVAEHLPIEAAEKLVKSLTAHADRVIFSAACPGQEGQCHINRQWPDYWQALFNKYQFRCEDSLRWKIWKLRVVEPWYRQNVFLAVKDPSQAGSEPRIPPVVHPAMFAKDILMDISQVRPEIIAQVESGSQSIGWYFTIPLRGLLAKLCRVTKSNA